jgi:predicted nuclease of predicted toxin-antitoxin system
MMRFYFDEMMPRPVANELTQRGHEVVMAVDVEMEDKGDPEHLQFAAENNMVLVTEDRAFAGMAARQTEHKGVICWTGKQGAFGAIVRVLHEFAETHTAEEVQGQTYWLK